MHQRQINKMNKRQTCTLGNSALDQLAVDLGLFFFDTEPFLYYLFKWAMSFQLGFCTVQRLMRDSTLA